MINTLRNKAKPPSQAKVRNDIRAKANWTEHWPKGTSLTSLSSAQPPVGLGSRGEVIDKLADLAKQGERNNLIN
jgi:hypothetical protein